MKTVLVTGSSGFIGKNLCVQLELDDSLKLLRLNRDASEKELKKYVEQADFIFHTAGINRPKDEVEFDKGNRELTEKILDLITQCGKKTPVLITSSTQADSDNPYGKSKKMAEDAVFKWSKATGNKVFVYRLPNVFGKWSRPNYNSVVATFCNNVARNLDINIRDENAELNLVYIDDVVKDFILAMQGDKKPSSDGYCKVPRNFKTTLGELAEKITSYKKSRDNLIMPSFEEPFDRFLYATYTSYLEDDNFSYPLDMKADQRGWLAEFIKSEQFGQIFVSKTKPGISRGNHWHHTKIEKFLVVDGEAEIKFRHVITGEVITYKVSGLDLRVLDIPAGYVHSITNTGKSDLTTIFWANELLDPKAPDTYHEEV